MIQGYTCDLLRLLLPGLLNTMTSLPNNAEHPAELKAYVNQKEITLSYAHNRENGVYALNGNCFHRLPAKKLIRAISQLEIQEQTSIEQIQIYSLQMPICSLKL